MNTAPAKILVIDDDSAIRDLIFRFLSQKQYSVKAADHAQAGIQLFEEFRPDLVILDINLPDALGYGLCEEMQRRADVYVLMLTSRSDAADKKEGFLKGADDYLTKPFDLQELELRINAILKRRRFQRAQEQKLITFGELIIDPERRVITIGGEPLTLTALEFNLLYFLASHPNRVWKRAELLQNVWGYDHVGDRRVVDVHIGQIRKKLEGVAIAAPLIHTVRGVGYKFELADSQEAT
ncbi:MAG: response regulator transcription factor [Cyanobacteria bacterium P01_H01_bin.15]